MSTGTHGRDDAAKLPSMEDALRGLLYSQRKYFERIWDEATNQIGGDMRHPYFLGHPNPRLLSVIGDTLGRDVIAKRQIITTGYVKHINNRHGANGKAIDGQIPVTRELFALIPNILENFDEVEAGHTTTGGSGILIRKKYANGNAVLVDAVPVKGNLYIKSFWVDKINNDRGWAQPNYGPQTDVCPG